MTELERLQAQLLAAKNKAAVAAEKAKEAKLKEKELLKSQKSIERKIKTELSKQARKERTKRLIEVGALLEKALNLTLDTEQSRKELYRLLTEVRTSSTGSTYSYASYFKNQLEKKTHTNNQ